MADEGTPPERPVEIDERLQMALLAGYPREQHHDALHFPLLFSLRPPPVESPSFAPHHRNVRGPTLSRIPSLSNPVEREEEPQFLRARTRTEDNRRDSMEAFPYERFVSLPFMPWKLSLMIWIASTPYFAVA